MQPMSCGPGMASGSVGTLLIRFLLPSDFCVVCDGGIDLPAGRRSARGLVDTMSTRVGGIHPLTASKAVVGMKR